MRIRTYDQPVIIVVIIYIYYTIDREREIEDRIKPYIYICIYRCMYIYIRNCRNSIITIINACKLTYMHACN